MPSMRTFVETVRSRPRFTPVDPRDRTTSKPATSKSSCASAASFGEANDQAWIHVERDGLRLERAYRAPSQLGLSATFIHSEETCACFVQAPAPPRALDVSPLVRELLLLPPYN